MQIKKLLSKEISSNQKLNKLYKLDRVYQFITNAGRLFPCRHSRFVLDLGLIQQVQTHAPQPASY